MRPPRKITIHYQDPDFELIGPDNVSELERIGEDLFRVSPTVICHRYVSDRGNYAENLMFIKENTTIPVPKVYGSYMVGPVPNPFLPGPDAYWTYIFLEDLKGDFLALKWRSIDADTQLTLSNELKGYVKQLHDLGEGSYVGSLNRGRIGDNLLGWEAENHGTE